LEDGNLSHYDIKEWSSLNLDLPICASSRCYEDDSESYKEEENSNNSNCDNEEDYDGLGSLPSKFSDDNKKMKWLASSVKDMSVKEP
jgi:hypothetical protein